jgi:hypothetical protein
MPHDMRTSLNDVICVHCAFRLHTVKFDERFDASRRVYAALYWTMSILDVCSVTAPVASLKRLSFGQVEGEPDEDISVGCLL